MLILTKDLGHARRAATLDGSIEPHVIVIWWSERLTATNPGEMSLQCLLTQIGPKQSGPIRC
jgi:hypothetical protein